jgi:hypothetical protein
MPKQKERPVSDLSSDKITIDGLERLLDEEPRRPIKILPDGTIEEIPGEPLPEVLTKLINQAWDY